MSRNRSKRTQQWRQQKIQQDRNQRLSRQQDVAESLLKQEQLGPEQPGSVIAQFGKHLLIEDRQGNIHECVSRRTVEKLVCGDKVDWRAAPNQQGVVVHRFARHSELARPNYVGKIRVIAANIDNILVVVAPIPKLDEDLINRYLIAAELTKIPAILVVNKIDMLDKQSLTELKQQLQIYQDLDIPLEYVSSLTGEGLAHLSPYFSNHLAIFVGQSGVGKSSIIKALLPDMNIRIGKISSRSGLGKHTTTAAYLYRVNQQGGLVDSPGIREFNLGHVNWQNIAQGFVEFQKLQNRCKFNDCKHQHEPGCVIKKAVAEGIIHEKRYQSYLRIIDSIAKP